MGVMEKIGHLDEHAGTVEGGRTAPAVAAGRTRAATWQARTVLSLLSRLAHGRLEVTLPDGSLQVFGSAASPCAGIEFRDWAVFADIVASGDIGFAEAYLRGDWNSRDLSGLLTLLAVNRDALEPAVYGAGFLRKLAARLRHLLRSNTRRGSRRNIEAHYDLGNEFYRLWLDPSMTYSSALFAGNLQQTLEQAQAAKIRRILERLAPRPGDHILEIGCGWGGFAEIAARDFGCRVTGITLSHEQLAWARKRIREAGLADRARFELVDYRDLQGNFDHVVSIEMFEAVGERFWASYFRTVAGRLRPGGRALIQAITISEKLFERYRTDTDFIQQYIFPGGMLASPARFESEANAAGLSVSQAHAFGPDYAETLRRWRAMFFATLPAVRALGFDERFVRMWEFYYAYCEAGFDSGCTDVYQFELCHTA